MLTKVSSYMTDAIVILNSENNLVNYFVINEDLCCKMLYVKQEVHNVCIF